MEEKNLIEEELLTSTLNQEVELNEVEQNVNNELLNEELVNGLENNSEQPHEVLSLESNETENEVETVNQPISEQDGLENEEMVLSTLTPEEIEQEQKFNEAYESAKWYALHTFSGYENVAKENLEIVIDKFNLKFRVFDIIIPMEDVVEEKNGKRKVVSRKLMPGYIFVKMIYGDDIWHAVTGTRGITGFVGPKGRPLDLTAEEIRKMHLEKVTTIDISIAVNDKVEVLDGPLSGFAGTVTSVDPASNKCRVVVEMFGRETPVDLSLTQIRKLD